MPQIPQMKLQDYQESHPQTLLTEKCVRLYVRREGILKEGRLCLRFLLEYGWWLFGVTTAHY